MSSFLLYPNWKITMVPRRCRVLTLTLLAVLVILSVVPANAQLSTHPANDSKQDKNVAETGGEPAPKIHRYTSSEIVELLESGQSVTLSGGVVTDELDIDDKSEKALTFRDLTFEDDVRISGEYGHITFERCRFERHVDFYVVRTLTLTMRKCEFLGAASFNLAVKGFTLRQCDFSKTVNLYGLRFDENSLINMTWLETKEPVRIFWSQFGEKWLRGLQSASKQLGEPLEFNSNQRQILAELEFWRDNFTRLGHRRDAAEVNYEIISFARDSGISIEPHKTDWWLSYLLSWPSRYGTRPYRPLWLGLSVICIFAFLFWVKDPFIEEDEKVTPKPRRPLLLFALMFSVDTFLPIFDVTTVKKWGWQLRDSYMWVGVTERFLGLLVLYSAAYSLTFYVL